MHFFQAVQNFFLGVATSVGIIAAQPTPTPTPIPAPVVEQTQNSSINGNYSAFGKNFNYSLNIPQGDGPISGNFSGDCQGNITGQKTGTNLTGQINGSCQLGLIKPEIKAIFTGTTQNHQATINYTITSPINKSGTAVLPLN